MHVEALTGTGTGTGTDTGTGTSTGVGTGTGVCNKHIMAGIRGVWPGKRQCWLPSKCRAFIGVMAIQCWQHGGYNPGWAMALLATDPLTGTGTGTGTSTGVGTGLVVCRHMQQNISWHCAACIGHSALDRAAQRLQLEAAHAECVWVATSQVVQRLHVHTLPPVRGD